MDDHLSYCGRNPAPVDRWFIPLFIGFQPSTVSVICVISFIQYSTPYICLGCVEMSLARHIRVHAKQNMERKFDEFVLNPTVDFCFSCEIMWGDICHRVPAPWSSSSTTCKWNSWSCAFSESFPAYFFNSSKKMKISDKSANQIDPPRSSNWDNCVNSRTSNCRNDSKFGEIISISSPKWNPLGSLILGPCLVHLGGTVRLRVTNITGRSYGPNWFQHRKHQTNQTIYFNHHISSYIIIYHHISSYIIIIFRIYSVYSFHFS